MPSLNPVLCRDATGDTAPAVLSDEHFLLRRGNIDLEANILNYKKIKANGRFFLTSHRLVFIVESG